MARLTPPEDAAWPAVLLVLCGVFALAALAGLAGSAPATALEWPIWSGATALACAAGSAALLRRQLALTRHALRQAEAAAADTKAQRHVVDAAQRAADDARELLVRAIEALPIGIEIYDEQNRLVLLNHRLMELHPLLPAARAVGLGFEDLLRQTIDSGLVPEAAGREAQWIARRLAEHGERDGLLLRLPASDRWTKVHERRTPGGYVVVSRVDVTDLIEQQRRTEAVQQEAQQARQLLRSSLETLDVGIEIYDGQDRLVLYNKKLNQFHPDFYADTDIGQTFEQLVRDTMRKGLISAAVGREEVWLAERLKARGTRRGPLLQEMAGDQWMHTHETRTAEGFTVTARVDVTELVRKERQLAATNAELQAAQREAVDARQLLVSALDAMPIGIEIYDAEDRLVLSNQRSASALPDLPREQLLGWTFDSLLRRNVQDGRIPAAIGREEKWLARRLAGRGSRHEPLLQELPPGQWTNIYEVRTPEGYVVTARADVSELVFKERQLAELNGRLAQLSATDSLTGIANRRRFDEALANEWLRGARGGASLSLLLVDIDHFKAYNDHYGHPAGDECLRRVAQVLTDCVRRAGELVARYGGEEFVMLLPGSDLAQAIDAATRCLERMQQEALVHAASTTSTHLTFSIGVACMLPAAALAPDNLVRSADAALYRAKAAGRACFETAS